MRHDVDFLSHGVRCAGWFYPAHAKDAPAIVMSHGLTAVKEFYLDSYASAFQAAGFAVLVFDYRFLGASGGTPRGRVVPQEQHDDLRAALAFVSGQGGIDPKRIGLWGTSFSGGHALYLGALDPRVKAIVAQVPAIHVAESLMLANGRAGFEGLMGLLAQDHEARNRGDASGSIAVVAPPGQPSLMPPEDAHRWFVKAAARPGAKWVNHTQLEALARIAEYVPSSFMEMISPKPLLIQAARHDSLIPLAQVERAFARAGAPKRLDVHDCGHFDPYTEEPWHGRFVEGAVDWFRAHL